MRQCRHLNVDISGTDAFGRAYCPDCETDIGVHHAINGWFEELRDWQAHLHVVVPRSETAKGEFHVKQDTTEPIDFDADAHFLDCLVWSREVVEVGELASFLNTDLDAMRALMRQRPKSAAGDALAEWTDALARGGLDTGLKMGAVATRLRALVERYDELRRQAREGLS